MDNINVLLEEINVEVINLEINHQNLIGNFVNMMMNAIINVAQNNIQMMDNINVLLEEINVEVNQFNLIR